MFDDWSWLSKRTDTQLMRFEDKFQNSKGRKDRNLCVIEIGAGTAVPAVRNFNENMLAMDSRGILIRINPAETEVKTRRLITIRSSALKALSEINSLIS